MLPVTDLRKAPTGKSPRLIDRRILSGSLLSFFQLELPASWKRDRSRRLEGETPSGGRSEKLASNCQVISTVSETEPPSCVTDAGMATLSSVFEGERPVRMAEQAVSSDEVAAAKRASSSITEHGARGSGQAIRRASSSQPPRRLCSRGKRGARGDSESKRRERERFQSDQSATTTSMT